GGAIWCNTLEVTDSTLSGNTALGGIDGAGLCPSVYGVGLTEGGAVWFIGGRTTPLKITNSKILNNWASLGGAFFIYSGQVAITNSVLAGNAATNYYAYSFSDRPAGGAIYALTSDLTVTGSTISGNEVGLVGAPPIAKGGGVYIVNGQMNLIASTISSNTVSGALAFG